MKSIVLFASILRIILITAILGFAVYVNAQNVALNTNGAAADASAMLDVSSTTKGFLPPRMTTIQRTGIQTPANGLLVFDTDTKSYWYFSQQWKEVINNGAGGLTLPLNATDTYDGRLFSIINTNISSSRVAIYGSSTPGNPPSTPGNPIGVWGYNDAGVGVMGTSNTKNGVFGASQQNDGVVGYTHTGNFAGVRGVGAYFYSYGVLGEATYGGSAIVGRNGANLGTSGLFENLSAVNPGAVVSASTVGTGPCILVNNTNGGTINSLALFKKNGNNVARIDGAGKGYFNGGTQSSGADLAEAFDVTGDRNEYETGDVLIISTSQDRAVEKSSQAYSTLVAGVYATKPGILLTEEDIDTDISDKVPMGVVGVIPTKVCIEGGEIKRGDLLVTSSIPGVAMKADIEKVKPGQVIGKALENFNSSSTGKIKVLVNVK